MAKQSTTELLVVGAGVIGLSCAWRAAQRGRRSRCSTRRPPGASWVAGGMLAPVTEAGRARRSCSRWARGRRPLARVRRRARRGRRPAGRTAHGRHARRRPGSGDRAELDASPRTSPVWGAPVERLSGRELRRLEPALGPDVRGGLSVPDDLAVDNRALLGALRTAAERLGVTFVAAAAEVVLDDGARVVGVRCVDGAERAADTVLVAAGAHSAGLHPALHGLVRPVKGEILRLALRPGAFPAPRRTVRALGRRPTRLPGAARRRCRARRHQSEVGFDTTVTVGGVRDLLRDAERILPGSPSTSWPSPRRGCGPAARTTCR